MRSSKLLNVNNFNRIKENEKILSNITRFV